MSKWKIILIVILILLGINFIIHLPPDDLTADDITLVVDDTEVYADLNFESADSGTFYVYIASFYFYNVSKSFREDTVITYFYDENDNVVTFETGYDTYDKEITYGNFTYSIMYEEWYDDIFERDENNYDEITDSYSFSSHFHSTEFVNVTHMKIIIVEHRTGEILFEKTVPFDSSNIVLDDD